MMVVSQAQMPGRRSRQPVPGVTASVCRRKKSRGPETGVSSTRSPSSALSHPFLGEGFPTKIDYRKRVPLFEPLYWRT